MLLLPGKYGDIWHSWQDGKALHEQATPVSVERPRHTVGPDGAVVGRAALVGAVLDGEEPWETLDGVNGVVGVDKPASGVDAGGNAVETGVIKLVALVSGRFATVDTSTDGVGAVRVLVQTQTYDQQQTKHQGINTTNNGMPQTNSNKKKKKKRINKKK